MPLGQFGRRFSFVPQDFSTGYWAFTNNLHFISLSCLGILRAKQRSIHFSPKRSFRLTRTILVKRGAAPFTYFHVLNIVFKSIFSRNTRRFSSRKRINLFSPPLVAPIMFIIYFRSVRLHLKNLIS